jgi:23S rRNA (pseudouridine1915-N3)-methyltransferase
MIRVIAFGKVKNSIYESITAEFSKRLGSDLKIIELNHIKGSENEIKIKEEKLLEKYLSDKSYKIFLDEKGQELTSKKLSEKIYNIPGNIDFFIGGAYGFTESILKKADFKLSLGKLTLPHMLARSILFEQIYRAKMINQNHPYHHQ